MRAAIEEVRAASADEWDSYWSACGTATYFQSREWAEVWAAYRGGDLQPDARLVRFADGAQALLPLSRQRMLGGRVSRWWCCPMTTYGGWLSDRPLEAGHVEALCRLVRSELTCVTWRMNPYQMPPETVVEGWTVTPDETLTVSLSCGFDELHARCAHGHRRAARKAVRDGVVVRPAAAHEEWSAYVTAYEDSRRRWGETTGHDRTLFDEFERREGERSVLWVAVIEGRVVGGLLCLYGPRHVACWHSAVLESALPHSPMPFVFLTAMKDACERGLDWFDFNPSKGLGGVEEFKRRFGAEPRACPVLTCERGLGVRVWHALEKVRGHQPRSPLTASGAAPR